MTRTFLALSATALSLVFVTAYSNAQTPGAVDAAGQPGLDAAVGAEAGSPVSDEAAIKEFITTRRVVMATIGQKADVIRGYVDGSIPFDGAGAAERASDISTLLLTFPHLFPPETNPEVLSEGIQDDPATSSIASPAIWQDQAGFTADALTVSDLALKTQFSPTKAEYTEQAQVLLNACDSCHAQWRQEEQPYEIPIPLQ